MKAIKTVFVLALVSTVTSSAIATDGDLGATSSGSSDLSVTTTEAAQITNIANITVNPYDAVGGAGIDEDDDVCIYTNDANTSYKVTATGNYDAAGDPGNGFFIKHSGNASTIAYVVKWNNTTGEGNTALTANTQSGVITGATNTYPCVTNNANFNVELTHNNIMSKPAGTYTGTLTLVIAPDNT